jgi:hypothetical protein
VKLKLWAARPCDKLAANPKASVSFERAKEQLQVSPLRFYKFVCPETAENLGGTTYNSVLIAVTEKKLQHLF